MRLLLISLTTAIALPTLAQTKLVDRRDQAEGWYLPVHGKVTASGGDTKNLKITVYRDNTQIGEITTRKGRFMLELDINHTYSITVEKEGYQSKMVSLDTALPDQEVTYPAYDCFLNLEPASKFAHSDPFYLDFPSAVVRWVPERGAFHHSSHYLTDIQVKMAFLQAQASPY